MHALQSDSSTPQSTLVAQLKDVKHQWHQGHPLFEISALQWHQGQTILLTGDNGAGKSTLMRLMAGLEPLQQGNIDYPTLPKSARRLPWQKPKPARGHCCYLHQTPYLFAGTVLDNLQFVIRSLPKAVQASALKRLPQGLALAGLTGLQHQAANTVSGGERQRIAALRAWLLQPKVLLLDEPTANLDQDSVQLITALVQDLIQENSAVMISSHQNTSLTACCNQHWMIEKGTVYAVETAAHNRTTALLNPTAHQPRVAHSLTTVVNAPQPMDVA